MTEKQELCVCDHSSWKIAASRASSGTLKDVLVWEQKNRVKNELAAKLAKISLTGDIGISVSSVSLEIRGVVNWGQGASIFGTTKTGHNSPICNECQTQ